MLGENNVNVYRLPVAVLTRFKMANMVILDRFIEDACQIALTWGGFVINSRKLLKLIVFSNYHVSQSIAKFKLPARTEPPNV